MDPATKLRPVRDVLLCPEEDEAFLYAPARGRVQLLNPTGLSVWRLLDGARDVGAVTAALAAAYPEVPAKALAADVAAFLAELEAAGLVEPVPRGP
jgi:hypothetical protein